VVLAVGGRLIIRVVTTRDDLLAATGPTQTVARGWRYTDELIARDGGCFGQQGLTSQM
jgi:hypothetical protein